VSYVPEPFIRRADQSGLVPLDILDVVELRRKRILNVNNDDFPVGFALVEKCHNAKDLDLLDLADISDLLADFADIQGVVIAFGFSLRVRLGRVFPSLIITIGLITIHEMRVKK
jgi:hypothetical protein